MRVDVGRGGVSGLVMCFRISGNHETARAFYAYNLFIT